jgi:hypothetical protein
MGPDDASHEETPMDEFAALAQRVVLTMDDVRGCLVLSRDGLVLGAFPEEEEANLKPAWLRFVHVGEARKGFVEFSDQLWAFVHRGPYAAFVVTGTSVRPGVMLDQLEQAVIAAEEARAKQKEVTLKVPDAPGAPSGRPRTSLHPSADRPSAAPAAIGSPAAEQVGSEAMPTYTAPTGTPESIGAAAAGADATQQMEAMRQQMEAMQQQLQQQALQQGTGSTGVSGQLSGYRRPEGTEPAPLAEPGGGPIGAAARPTADLPPATRPSLEGSLYESVVTDDGPPAFGTESSPFARLESERQAAERPSPPDVGEVRSDPFRQEPQRLMSSGPEPVAQEGEDEAAEVDRVMLAKEFSGLLQVGEDDDEE